MAADGSSSGAELLQQLGIGENKLTPDGFRLNLTRGRTAVPIRAEFLRELTEADLVEIGSAERGVQPIPLKELRVQHHSIAKLLANGHKPGEVSMVLGIGLSRISILQGDPTFQELVAYYADLGKEEFERHRVEMSQMLHDLGADSLSILHERLLEKPETFSVKEIADIVRLAADRSGFGPSATVNTNVTHSLDDSTLERIRHATSAPQAAVSADDRQRLLGLAVRATELHSEAEVIEAEFSECKGAGVREESAQPPDREVAGALPLPSVDNVP